MKLLNAKVSAFSLVGLVAAGVGVLIVASRFLVITPTGQVGVLDQMGQVSQQVLTPGIHLRSPFARVINFSTRTKEFKETAEAPSKDGLVVTVDVSILYHVDPDKAKQLYQTVGGDYERVILVPQFRSLIRQVTANYDAKSLYTSQRQAVAQQLRQELGQTLATRGLVVEDILLRNVILPESIQTAVQEKLQAEQDSQRMEFVLQKERKEADRKRIEAQGIADSQRIISQGLTDKVLQFKQIEATEKLAQSQNAKVIVIGDQKGSSIQIQP